MTYDPRGVERSERTDPDLEVTPELHAADVCAVIEAVGGGRVDVFASSGGAVNALALVASQPDLVQTLVAHEPPVATLVPDATDALAACRAVHETYQQHGWGAGMAHFIALVSLRGPVPADFATQQAPDPSMFGTPTQDDGRPRRPDARLEHRDHHPPPSRRRRASRCAALDGVHEALTAGAKVADIGCGHGASTILMAEAYPASTFTGFDYHEASIDTARQRAAAAH